MIEITNTEVFGWGAALRGMRNPMNSWSKSDSYPCWAATSPGGGCMNCENKNAENCHAEEWIIGKNDYDLMQRLVKAGSDHGKFMRMIDVTCDITAMQPWWMEFDTYKVSTVRNSCSKMHKIHVKEFTMDDFEHQGIDEVGEVAVEALKSIIRVCNALRTLFNDTHEKRYWRALIELLPEGYRMKATVHLNYQVLRNMYHARCNHKLTEWDEFCRWVQSLPYSELITM
jgi:hypothetical protein